MFTQGMLNRNMQWGNCWQWRDQQMVDSWLASDRVQWFQFTEP